MHRTTRHIRAQVIDDQAGRTIVSASSLDKDARKDVKSGGNIAAAKVIGRMVAERARAAGVELVVFDRGGFTYHGRVAALADALRKEGVTF